jgi:hypothetical protein
MITIAETSRQTLTKSAIEASEQSWCGSSFHARKRDELFLFQWCCADDYVFPLECNTLPSNRLFESIVASSQIKRRMENE